MFTASTTDLYFALPHNRVITNTVKLTNNTGVDTVIKMRTTSRDKFHVRPRIFALPTGQSIDVAISNRPFAGAGVGSTASGLSRSGSFAGNGNGTPRGGDGSSGRRGSSPSMTAAGHEITDADECHAVVHQIAAKAPAGPDSSAEQLQVAWDAGSAVGRVAMRCHVADPPANSNFVTYHSASARLSKSPSLPGRGGSFDDLAYNGGSGSGHNHTASSGSIRALNEGSNSNNNGLPPLPRPNAQRRTSMEAQRAGVANQRYAQDGEVNRYKSNSNDNNNNVEQVSSNLHRHERSLQKSVNHMAGVASASHAASQAVAARTPGIAERGSEAQLLQQPDASSSSGPLQRVPLSLTVLCMMLAFIAGLLLKQAAIAHDAI